MNGQPHPVVMMKFAEQRVADFHAEAARHRRVRLAQQRADHRAVWPDAVAVAAVVLLLALLLVTASGLAAAQTVSAANL